MIVVGGLGTQQGVVDRVYHDVDDHQRQQRRLIAQLEDDLRAATRQLGSVNAQLSELTERLTVAGRIATGPLVVDLVADRATVDGWPIPLAPGDWDLLAILARNVGDVVARRDLLAALWPDQELRAGRRAGRRLRRPWSYPALRACVGRLRAALGPASDLVETQPGHGYCLRLVPVADAAEV